MSGYRAIIKNVWQDLRAVRDGFAAAGEGLWRWNNAGVAAHGGFDLQPWLLSQPPWNLSLWTELPKRTWNKIEILSIRLLKERGKLDRGRIEFHMQVLHIKCCQMNHFVKILYSNFGAIFVIDDWWLTAFTPEEEFPESIDWSWLEKPQTASFPSQIVISGDKPQARINTISGTVTSKLIKIARRGTMVPICSGWAECQHGLPQGYFSPIVWGLETPPEGSLQPRHYYLAMVWDNRTVPLLFLVKVHLQLISDLNLFMSSCTDAGEKRRFQSGAPGFSVWESEQRGIMSYRVNRGERGCSWVTPIMCGECSLIGRRKKENDVREGVWVFF